MPRPKPAFKAGDYVRTPDGLYGTIARITLRGTDMGKQQLWQAYVYGDVCWSGWIRCSQLKIVKRR